MDILGGAETVQPATGIVIKIPYEDYGSYQYAGGGYTVTSAATTRKEYKYTITLEEAEKIRNELNEAIHSAHKIRDFFDL